MAVLALVRPVMPEEPKSRQLTEEDIERIVNRAAKEGAREGSRETARLFLYSLGINPDNPESVDKFRDNQAFLRDIDKNKFRENSAFVEQIDKNRFRENESYIEQMRTNRQNTRKTFTERFWAGLTAVAVAVASVWATLLWGPHR